MRTLELESYCVMEMDTQEMMIIDGEYSWKEFAHDAAYTVGYTVGAATKAADILGNWLKDEIVAITVNGPFIKK